MGFFSIILLILKIIGIILASVLGLILLLILVVLFVPFRYRVRAEKTAELSVKASFSWILHLLHVSLAYGKDGMRITVRLFGFKLFGMPEDKTKKAKKSKQKKKKAIDKPAAVRTETAKADGIPEKVQDSPKTIPVQTTEETPADAHGPEKTEKQAAPEPEPGTATGEQTVGEETPKETVFQKIKKLVMKPVTFVKNLRYKLHTLSEFLGAEENKAGVKTAFGILVRVLKHIAPRRARGYIAFGMQDPATTGYILAVLGIFYAKFGKSFSIQPDFEEARFEAEFKMRGRIYLITLLTLFLKLWFNNEFMTLRNNFSRFTEKIKENPQTAEPADDAA